jgi:signal transduction histidine kinase
MLDRLMRRTRRPSGRDLQVLFAVTIVLPGVLLAVVGIRAWLQERRLADQQLRERVDRAADLALRGFEQDLRSWQALLDRVGRSGPPSLESLDHPMRDALTAPGAGALILQGPDGPTVWPERQAPYALAASAVPDIGAPQSRLLETAELVEMRNRDHARAIALYRDAIRTLPPGVRAPGLLRLARTFRKAGREPEALAIYRGLVTSSERMGALPADLVARHELCALVTTGRPERADDCRALDLYRDLVEGRWRLPKTRYLFYSENVRRMLDASTATSAANTWVVLEQHKLALAEAAASTLAQTSAGDLNTVGPVLVIRTRAAPGVALLLSRTWLAASRWPQTFRTAVAGGYDVVLQEPGGDTWYDSSPDQGAASTTATRQPDMAGAAWRLRVTPLDPATLMADVSRWRTLTLVMLLLLVALLAFGTYLTTRVVRREMEVARLQSDFVSTVSHEFRSPLTGIRQLGEMLLRGRVPDESRRHEYYERITRESDRLSRLVENLLDVAQIDAGRKQYRFEPLDTSAWLRRVVDEARTNPAHRQTRIETRIPDALPPLTGDREALSSAVHNLLDNAVKYSPGADAVWCEAEVSDGRITIRVRDHGVGMSDDDRRHVFERFRRGRGPITEQVKGTGLGLSLVDHIVRAHGGRVECDSRLGEGTTFSIHFAASPADPGV